VNDRFIKYKGLDISGVGATACGRHGCFCPGAVVDFHKGERSDTFATAQHHVLLACSQANMDYSLSQALQNTNVTGLKRIILIYDIMCQYSKRLNIRMEESEYIMLPFGLAILHGIGLFHVGGHVWRCFSRFSPSFISGAGQVDGEILESLWSVLNEISPSAQNATIAGRTEILDDHLGDSNFKKMLDIGMGFCFTMWCTYSGKIVLKTCQRFEAAVAGEEESRSDLLQYTNNSTPDELEDWKAISIQCQEDRLTDPTAMDIYDIDPGQAAVTKSSLQMDLLVAEGETGDGKGETTWLALGLKLQEAQCVLLSPDGYYDN
jgi:hypothetical protein